MRKLSSYQKLKKKITNLETDIYYLVEEPDTENGITVRLKYEMKYALDREVWRGSGSSTNIQGLFSQIEYYYHKTKEK
jgi:hypothetical protein